MESDIILPEKVEDAFLDILYLICIKIRTEEDVEVSKALADFAHNISLILKSPQKGAIEYFINLETKGLFLNIGFLKKENAKNYLNDFHQHLEVIFNFVKDLQSA